MSLRLRLMAGLVGVVLVGLVATYGTTYYVVRSFLLDRVDAQLGEASTAVKDRADHLNTSPQPGNDAYPSRTDPRAPLQGGPRGARPAPPSFLPPGTFGEVRHADGTSVPLVFGLETSYSPPELPADVAKSTKPDYFTVSSVDGSFDYRVRSESLSDGSILLSAIPLTGLDQTLGELRLAGLAVSGVVLLVLAVLAYWLVRLGLRPLDAMASAAGEIASGDLTRRIEHADTRTEVGRLGTALNQMLESLEHAFSEQKASEDQLRRFLADASHELRTPLTSIRGYAELFQRGASQRPEDLAKVMRRVDEESARMSVLVEDLLLLARLNQGRPLERANVDLTRLARDAVDDASVVAPSRTIRLEDGAVVTVPGDESRLRQVVANLVTNALNHTPPEAPVVVSVHAGGGRAVLEVADLGPGLAPDDAAHVFEPFYRVDKGRVRAKGGTGLGLAIVKAIVEAHGGNVGVRANAPNGSVFEVSLPQ